MSNLLRIEMERIDDNYYLFVYKRGVSNPIAVLTCYLIRPNTRLQGEKYRVVAGFKWRKGLRSNGRWIDRAGVWSNHNGAGTAKDRIRRLRKSLGEHIKKEDSFYKWSIPKR